MVKFKMSSFSFFFASLLFVVQPHLSHCEVLPQQNHRIFFLEKEDDLCVFINNNNWQVTCNDDSEERGFTSKNYVEDSCIQFSYHRSITPFLNVDGDSNIDIYFNLAKNFLIKSSNKNNVIYREVSVDESTLSSDNVVFKGYYYSESEAGFFKLMIRLQDKVSFAYMHVPAVFDDEVIEMLFDEMTNFVVAKVEFADRNKSSDQVQFNE